MSVSNSKSTVTETVAKYADCSEKSAFLRSPYRKRTSSTPWASMILAFVSFSCPAGLTVLVYVPEACAMGGWIPHVRPVQPSVLMGLLQSIYHTCCVVLVVNGITITWWRALRKGDNLFNLHYICEWNALRISRFNLVSVAMHGRL